MSNLCELGAGILLGTQVDGTHRVSARGQNVGQVCYLGTFAEYTVVPIASVIRLDPSVALDKVALLGCGVTTGYGSAVRTGETRAGDTVVVMGVGGVGINAVPGCAYRGRAQCHRARPGGIQTRSRAGVRGHARRRVGGRGMVAGQRADRRRDNQRLRHRHRYHRGPYLAQALSLVGKRGRVVVTAVPHPTDTSAQISLFDLFAYEKQVRGSLFGSSNPAQRHPAAVVPLRQRTTQARRTDHPRVFARGDQPGLRRHAQRREPARADPLLTVRRWRRVSTHGRELPPEACRALEHDQSALSPGDSRSHASTGTQAGAEARADGLSSTAPTVIGPASDDGDLDQLQVGQLVSGGGVGGVADRVVDIRPDTLRPLVFR